MKIDKNSLIVGLLIGFMVGGAVIGILDAKRPKPIFSKASSICNDYLEASRFATSVVKEIDARVKRTGIPENESRDYWQSYYQAMIDAWQECDDTALLQ